MYIEEGRGLRVWDFAHRQYLGRQTVALAGWLVTLCTVALRRSESAPTPESPPLLHNVSRPLSEHIF